MNNTFKPILSIIVPIYNVEKYICKCLDSIYSQSIDLNSFEVITVNDGTKDQSAELVKPYCSKYPNCFLINQDNGGLSVARNTGFMAAKGSYVWFVDSDDWLLEGSIDYVLSLIIQYPETDIFASSLLCHYEDTGIEEAETQLRKEWLSGIEYFENGYPYGAAQRSIYKKDFIVKENISFAPGLLHEDALWGFQVYYCANRTLLLNRHIYAYLKRKEGSIMSSVKVKSAYDLVEIHKRLFEFMKRRVKKQDQEFFERKIMNVLCAAYQFTKPIWKQPGFVAFEKENRSYIRKMALSSFHVKGGWKKGIFMLLSPKLLYLNK